MKHKIGIVGCGLIGQKRAANLSQNVELVSCFDDVNDYATAFAEKYGCSVSASLQEMLSDTDISAIIVATYHSSLADIGGQVLRSGKHLFLEKPGATNWRDLSSLIDLNNDFNRVIWVGYNHRFHDHARKMVSLIQDGEIGELMLMRARYGHGGRVGYDKEWRAKKELSGGGELIDQGAHLIDLASMILGDLKLCYG